MSISSDISSCGRIAFSQVMRAISLFVIIVFTALVAGSGTGPENWVAAWTAAPAEAGPLADARLAPGGLRNRTIRNIVHPSIGGRALRVRLTNVFGAETLVIDEVDIGIQRDGGSLVRGSSRPVTFGGYRKISIPAGAMIYSDPVNLTVSSAQNLAVSIFSASNSVAATAHPASFQDSFISGTGDFADRAEAGAFPSSVRSWLFLSGIEVSDPPLAKGVIAAFGDSITDGDGSTPNANRRWPDFLVRRLSGEPGGPPVAVVNAGIAGNRVLSNSPCFGLGAEARFGRDVLSQPGVRAVILMEGINDILHPDYAASHKPDRIYPCVMAPQVSVDDLTAAYGQIALQAHAKSLKIYGGTITPFEGFSGWSKAGEVKRQAINAWIKTGGAFDGVIDFAAAVADPQDPARLAPRKDSGDHIHPNDTGYAAMAGAIDLCSATIRSPG
jgi:lysophospholipase L1-like esterase